MKSTRIQINYLLTMLALCGLQVYFLWELNGSVVDFIENADIERVLLFFAPTAGVVWCAKHLVLRGAETDIPDDNHERR